MISFGRTWRWFREAIRGREAGQTQRHRGRARPARPTTNGLRCTAPEAHLPFLECGPPFSTPTPPTPTSPPRQQHLDARPGCVGAWHGSSWRPRWRSGPSPARRQSPFRWSWTGSFLDAMRLALAEDDAENGPIAGLDTLLILEVSNRAGPSLVVAQEMVDRPGMVAVVGHANSTSSLATSQVYNRHRVVQVAPTSTAPLFSEAGPYSFRMVPPDHVQGRFLAEKVAELAPEGARLALYYVNDDYGRALRTAVLPHLQPDRHPVVLDLPHSEGDVHEVNPEELTAALVASGAHFVLWLGRVPALATFLPRATSRVAPLTVLAGDAVSRAHLLFPLEGWWHGVSYTDFLDITATPELRDFRRRFQHSFDADPGGPEALVYDATRAILAAIRGGARTGEEVRRSLSRLGAGAPPYPGITGPLTFDEHGDVVRDYVVRTIGPPGDAP
ncbi:MAG: ABC transporter substrate-binding protein [Gemmatimonadota bacterium]